MHDTVTNLEQIMDRVFGGGPPGKDAPTPVPSGLIDQFAGDQRVLEGRLDILLTRLRRLA